MAKELTKNKKAIVIGSGFGGLACAIRLQASGVQTTLVEKRDKPGGRAYVFEDQGFVFDAGPTVITAPHCIEELFKVSNKSMNDYVQLEPITPFYRLHWEDGLKFDYSNDDQALLAQIKKLNPGDVEGYQKFKSYSKEVFIEGYEKLAAVPFLNWTSMIRVAPQLIKLSAYRTVYSMVSKFIKDPHLRRAFSFHSLLVGGNPFSCSSIYTLIHFLERKWGVYFAKGGTHALVKGLVRLFTDLGGHFFSNSPVDEILTNNKQVVGVRLKTGDVLSADIVVSNADVVHTYNNLMRKEEAVQRKAKSYKKKPHSMSLFVIYFGTKKKYPHLAHHNVFFGSRYKGLLKDIFKKGVLADDFSLYLHAPTRTDPSLAPPDCENFYVLSPVPHLGKAAIDWKKEGPVYADRILSYLDQRYIPGLKEHLVTKRIFTPEDFKNELNAHWGSAFSLEPLLRQSAYFRTHNKDEKIKGLYFAGAGTHPGAGIPGVVNSAKATANLIFNDYSLSPKKEKSYAHV